VKIRKKKKENSQSGVKRREREGGKEIQISIFRRVRSKKMDKTPLCSALKRGDNTPERDKKRAARTQYYKKKK